jgi:hypothetical protein
MQSGWPYFGFIGPSVHPGGYCSTTYCSTAGLSPGSASTGFGLTVLVFLQDVEVVG